MKNYLVLPTTVLALLFGLSGVAIADCHLDGTIYAEGAIVSGYICKDGDWVQL